jgi:hypothetical protein
VHTFAETSGGTKMTDHVDYVSTRFSWVRGDVESIFAYREKIIRERFS